MTLLDILMLIGPAIGAFCVHAWRGSMDRRELIAEIERRDRRIREHERQVEHAVSVLAQLGATLPRCGRGCARLATHSVGYSCELVCDLCAHPREGSGAGVYRDLPSIELPHIGAARALMASNDVVAGWAFGDPKAREVTSAPR